MKRLGTRHPALPLLRCHGMVCELEVPIVSAGATAFTAEDDLQQIPVQAGLIRAEPFDKFGDIENGTALACHAVD